MRRPPGRLVHRARRGLLALPPAAKEAGTPGRSAAGASKAEWRAHLRATRGSLPAAQLSAAALAAAERLLALPGLAEVGVAALYLPLAGELDTLPLAERLRLNGVRIVLPRVIGATLDFAPGPPAGALRGGFRGSLEPTTAAVAPESIDLIVVPGVGFDLAGNRLGQGGGHYDRALGELTRAVRVGYGFDCQVVERLPGDDWDQGLDAVVTESRSLRFPTRAGGRNHRGAQG
ncbi:MAG: 5-formyltetrahydrofolate cyclo-ligase [Candidatus Dormibacteraeota bacterium]|nr:5-formyltetrahydrofolate cyclo-ligase [Candidatus Dormibacteraeota bacterium]